MVGCKQMVTLVSKPTLQDFVYTLVRNWASLVSGALSAPFTVISIYSSNPNTKLTFALLAACGVLVAFYQLWAQEREERIKTQDELEQQTAKLGRPEITLGLKNDEKGQLWVCLMNYSERTAVNVRADDVQCGHRILRLINLPAQLRSGFSPNIQIYCVGDREELDIATTCILNLKKGTHKFESLQLAFRYTDIDAANEWVSFVQFFYNINSKRFELEKQWVKKTESEPKPILT